MKQQREPAIQKAYSDCFVLLTKHYYDSGDTANREALIETYKELLTKFLSGRVLAGSGLNIRFLTTVFEQCPALAWNLHDLVIKCFLVKDVPKTTETAEDDDDKKPKVATAAATTEGSRNNHQRIQAIELYQLLIRVAVKDTAAKELLAKNFALLGAVIGKVV